MGTVHNNFGVGGFGQGLFGSGAVGSLPQGYYLNLITSQYKNSPKMIAWLTAKLQKLDDITYCLASLATAFDLDYAVGPQLDILGQLIGQSRIVGFQPTGGGSPTLADVDYRILLRARIAQNQWTGRIDALQGTWQTLFPGGKIVIADQQNMSADIILTGAFTQIQRDLIQNGYIVPRPEGVGYNFTFAQTPLFGADLNTSLIAGADTGHAA